MKFILPRFLINIERWRWNDEFRIYVSNTGRCKDEYKKELPVKINTSGYCMVKTYIGYKSMHRLVMMTWRPTRDMENLTVDHLDHNKRNNTLTNLEWVSYGENQKRAHNDQVTTDLVLPTGMKLTFGKSKKFFATYHEAAVWVLNNFISAPDREKTDIKNIEKRIKNSILQNKRYYNYKWRFVPVYE